MKKNTKARKATAARKPATKPAPPPTTAPAESTKATKKDAVIALLRREGGATLDELMTSTGWQAHSVRGFISGTLRKKLRLTVDSVKREDGLPAYQICA